MSDMPPPYKIWPGLKSHALGEQALILRKAYTKPCRLSPLIAMSDPVRTPDVLGWATSLPEHCAVIYRFEVKDDGIVEGLKKITTQKHQQLLLRQNKPSKDAQGLHFRRHADLNEIEKIRDENTDLLLTLAAIKSGEYNCALPNIDGILVSSIFPSQSPSAGAPIGVEALKCRVKEYDRPVFALGGINQTTASQLLGSGVAGVAAVGSLSAG